MRQGQQDGDGAEEDMEEGERSTGGEGVSESNTRWTEKFVESLRTEHKAEVRCTKPVRSAWSKGHPLSKRDWTASKLGPWSIPWKKTPE